MAGGSGGAIPGAVPRSRQLGYYKRRLPQTTPIPYGTAAALPAPVPPPPFVNRLVAAAIRGLSVLTRPPSATATIPTVRVLPPRIVREPRYPFAGAAAFTRLRFKPPPGVAGRILPPAVHLLPHVPFAGAVTLYLPPSPKRTSPRPLPPFTFRRDETRPGHVYLTRKLQPPPVNIAGKLFPALTVSLSYKPFAGFAWIGKTLAPPVQVAGRYLAPVVVQRVSDRYATRLRNSGVAVGSAFAHYPPSPTGIPGPRLILKHGPADDIPTAQLAEPLFTSDTFQLFVGNGKGNTFVGGMSAAPSHSSAPGFPGMTASDGTYFYYCYALNSWGRVALTSF